MPALIATGMDASWYQRHSGSKTGLFGKLDCAKVLLQLLKVLQFKEDVVFQASDNGIKITAEVSKSFFASAFIRKETFSEYHSSSPDTDSADEDAEEIVFGISLSTLVQCLNVCGSGSGGGGGSMNPAAGGSLHAANTSLLLHQPDVGQPLYLWLEEGGVVTGASIPTLDPTGFDLDFSSAMDQNTIVARIIITAENLCDIFSEFDGFKNQTIEFKVCPAARTLQMTTSSTAVSIFSVEIPFDSEMVSHFQVDKIVKAKYHYAMLKHALKPISMADKVSIRFDSREFLSIQYMVKLNDVACFLEFYCAPEVE